MTVLLWARLIFPVILIALCRDVRVDGLPLGEQEVSGAMAMVSVLRAAGDTDPGLQREVNEDRFHFDLARRLFMVVDGVGGQAAGGKAADTAVRMLRSRLERETGPAGGSHPRGDHDREQRDLPARPPPARMERHGLRADRRRLDEARAIVGHVGDTRLYKIRRDRIEKVTRDHSPVGEREDAQELSELEAMHHPRRNEVYRDVGSEPHEASDPDFMDVVRDPVRAGCRAAALQRRPDRPRRVRRRSPRSSRRWAGQPQQVVRGSHRRGERRRRQGQHHRRLRRRRAVRAAGRRRCVGRDHAPAEHGTECVRRLERRQLRTDVEEPASKRRQAVRWMLLVLLTIVIVLAVDRSSPWRRSRPRPIGLQRCRIPERSWCSRQIRFAAALAECRRRNHGDRRARRVSRNDDAQELHPRRQSSSPRRAHQAAGQRIGCRRRDPGA